MRVDLLCLVMLTLVGPVAAIAAEYDLNGHRFTLPDGFEIELAAGLPLVKRPITADFDERGRLYVSESSGSNENVRIQLEKKPHRILRLEDTDGDGQFDRSVVFADRMMFPEGTLWYDGSLYVGAPPQIWKLTDTDEDGVADQREVWFDGKTLNGCANDLHGPYLGPDGWIYWAKGAFEKQTYERKGRKPFITRASHIFRRRPDGGEIEPVMTGGMDNPVDVAFTRDGERFFTTTFLHHPRDGKRDGIIHAIYGGVYGKPHGVLDGHARTGELMPVMSHMGAAAPCGMTTVESAQLGEDYVGNLLACQFNKHKISRHQLKRSGGAILSDDSDFLVSTNLDFHPTDIIEDADGSLIVVDTGGWYKLCCPTSQLHKPDVPGAIYRVKRAASHEVNDPRGQSIVWSSLTPEQLVSKLDDARPAVRERASQELGKRGAVVVPAVAEALKSGDNAIRLQAVWALSRVNAPEARSAVRNAINDRNAVVRHAAVHTVSVWRDRQAADDVASQLRTDSLYDRRVLAEAIGRIGTGRHVEAILHAAGLPSDRVTQHSLIHALIEIGDAEATRRGLGSKIEATWLAAAIALDQMDGGSVSADEVVPLLTAYTGATQQTAWWLVARHPEWAPSLTKLFRDQLSKNSPADSGIAARLSAFAGDVGIQTLMGELAADSGSPHRPLILQAMASSRVGELPESWGRALLVTLRDRDVAQSAAAVSTINRLAESKPGEAIVGELRNLAADESKPVRLRLQALATACIADSKAKRGRTELTGSLRDFVCSSLSIENSVTDRALAADVLTSAGLQDNDRKVVAESLASTGPMELKRLLPVFRNVSDSTVGMALVHALSASAVSSSLKPVDLSAALSGFDTSVKNAARPLFARIETENAAKLAKIDAVLARMEKSDERRGQKIFHSTKTSCIACHQMGYLGGSIGPSLNRIGGIRTERDLLESILFPSASFVRSYEPVSIITTEGRVYNGIIKNETATEVELVLDAKKTVRIAHEDIDERKDGTVSVMPAGLEKQLSDQDFADLIRFLKVSR